MGSWDLPSQSWVVLDTNFLIDSYSKQKNYTEIVSQLKEQGNSIVSVEFVRCEFIRSRTLDVVKSKSIYFAEVVESLLPIDQDVNKLIQPTVEAYGEDIDKVSLTDIFLACTIQRYSKVYLLTRNHSDFPLKLFTRSHVFNIESEKDIKTYALYQYKSPSATEIKAELNEIPF